MVISCCVLRAAVQHNNKRTAFREAVWKVTSRVKRSRIGSECRHRAKPIMLTFVIQRRVSRQRFQRCQPRDRIRDVPQFARPCCPPRMDGVAHSTGCEQYGCCTALHNIASMRRGCLIALRLPRFPMGLKSRILVSGDHARLRAGDAAVMRALTRPDELRLRIFMYLVGIRFRLHGFITTLMQPSVLSRNDL